MADQATSPQAPLLSGDDPIEQDSDDLLRRSKLAEALAMEILGMDARRGGVIAITGKWGTGKTSLLNLTAKRLEEDNDTSIVEFNPWFFSGTDQLMGFFFDELANQLRDEESKKVKFKRVGAAVAEKFNHYASALSPLKFVPVAGAAIGAAGAISEGAVKLLSEERSVHAQRAEITELLSTLPGRIVVLIDDIDRLSREEIRDLFRLVRLNGSFPNVIYVLCFDRRVVEAALQDEGISGSQYLEKIVRTSIDIPPAAPESLAKILNEGIAFALKDIDTGPFDSDRWADVFWQVLHPLFSTLRDVKRFLSSLPLAVRAVGDEVNLVDVLALEGLRSTKPSAHEAIATMGDALTSVRESRYLNSDTTENHRKQVDSLLGMLPDDVGRALIRLVFPAAQRYTENISHGSDWLASWRRQRRVANISTLNYYLHRELPAETAASALVDKVASALGDGSELRAAFEEVPDGHLEDLLERLLPYVEEVSEEAVYSSALVLLELFPRLREESRGMYDFGAEFAVLRPVLRLLKKVDSSRIEGIVEDLLRETSSFYARHRLLLLVGNREDAGAKLISPDFEQSKMADFRDSLRSADPESLLVERDLLRIVANSFDCDPSAGIPALESARDTRVAARLLETGLTSVRRQTIGSVAVRSSDRLAWDSLVAVYGGEENLREVVERLNSEKETNDSLVSDRVERALSLYERYASGWRPREFGDD